MDEPSKPRKLRRDLLWEKRLAELLDYHRIHGDFNVPAGWPKNPALANWVSTQRRLLRLGRLSADRLWRLNEVGVRW